MSDLCIPHMVDFLLAMAVALNSCHFPNHEAARICRCMALDNASAFAASGSISAPLPTSWATTHHPALPCNLTDWTGCNCLKIFLENTFKTHLKTLKIIKIWIIYKILTNSYKILLVNTFKMHLKMLKTVKIWLSY